MQQEIPLSQPDITQAEIDAVVSVLQSGRLSIGPRQDLFEQLVADRCQRRHGIAISSGTAGLHAVLLALNIGPGDEVITSPFTFIAPTNAILMCGAKPVFVDICPTSLNMDPDKVEAAITDKTKAILAVENFGNPCGFEKLQQIALHNEIPLIEDACEGLGGSLKGRPVGSFGRAAVFGFYPNKQITTGEGGMVVTDDDRLADMVRSLRNQGRGSMGAAKTGSGATGTGSWLSHERLGYNYRLSEINAALGVVQMQRLDAILEARRRVASMYMRRLMAFDDLMLPNVPQEQEDVFSWFVFVVRLNDLFGRDERDRIIAGMRRHEVGAADYFPCIHLQPHVREALGTREGDFPISESIAARTLALPFYNTMTETEVDLVCQTLKVMIQREHLTRP